MVVGYRARRDRGITLIATVLMSVVAATISLVLVRQTVLSARADSVNTAFDDAYRMALSAKTSFEQELAADPLFYTKSVFRYERPRLCTKADPDASTPGATVTVPVLPDPGSRTDVPWPADCGQSWTYLGDGGTANLASDDQASGPTVSVSDGGGNTVSWDPAQHPIRMEIVPPSASDPLLTVHILASSGSRETGLTATYRRSSATEVTAYSAGDLRMDSLYSPTPDASGTLTVSGTLYAGGKLYLPTSPADFTGAQLFAEGGFVGATPDTGRLYTSTVAGGGQSGTLGDIRSSVPDPLTLDGLRAAYPQLAAAGCPSGTPALRTMGGVTYSTRLCLRSGTDLLDTAGQQIVDSTTGTQVGAAPAAYLLLFAGTRTAPTVKVYTAATAPAQVGDCVLRCDLSAVSQADYKAGVFPASPPAAQRSTAAGAPLWQPLGEFPLPVGGVLVTDADTYIGQCPASVGQPQTGCPTSTAQASVTVVAGSPDNPADVIIGSSLTGAKAAAGQPAAQLGLVATKSLVVPFYARRPGGDLSVTASTVAYGYGLPAGQTAVRTVPAKMPEQADEPNNFGGTFTLTGSVAAPSLDTDLPGWGAVQLHADPQAVLTPPPDFPGFSSTWTASTVTRLSSYQVCSANSCATRW